MARRIIFYAVPVLLISLFVVVLGSSSYLKEPRGGHDDVQGLLGELRTIILAERWNDAQNKLNDLENAFGGVMARIQYSTNRRDIREMERSLSRLRGALVSENKELALVELYEASYQWHSLGR